MENLTNLQKDIVLTLNVEYDPLKISIIDSIKFYLDFLGPKKLEKILLKYKNSNDISDIDKYIINKILDPLYSDFMCIQQTYYDNLLLCVYFILNNPFLFSTFQLECIYNNLDLMSHIPIIINFVLNKMYSNPKLKNFYNEFTFKRWSKSLDFKKMSFEKYIEIVKTDEEEKGNNIDKLKNFYNMYSKVWNVFEKATQDLKVIIQDFCIKYKGMNHIPGCTNISKQFYAYCASTHIGLPIGDKITFNNLAMWGISEFKRVKKLMKETIDRLEPELKSKSIEESIKIINNMKKYKYKSKEEYVKDHVDNMKKYRDYFVKERGLPLLHEPLLVDFDEEKMAGGYWWLDTFYLNTNRWMDTNKFDTAALVLHETIPGHHLQLSYEIHGNKLDSLILWFPQYVNGYAEGWGLFSEKLGHDLDDFKYLGILNFLMMRTLRIIADTSIHYYCIEPEELLQFFKKYLPMPEESIRSEIYRYVSLPGQALCYKIGDEILKRLFVKKFGRSENLIEDENIKFYDELIRNGTMPLELLCKKYDVEYKF
jgi:hypothetical protein